MLVVRSFRRASLFPAALCLALASEARASSPVALQWSAPEDCPASDEVLDEVRRLLGERTAPSNRVLHVKATVKRKKDGKYVVRLEIPGADGPRFREVSAISCSALGQATALILAMMVDPEAALTAPEGPGQTNAQPIDISHIELRSAISESSFPMAFASPMVVPVTKNRDRTRARSFVMPRLRRSGSLQVLGDVGSLPGPALGWGGTIGILPGQWRFALGFAYFFERDSSFAALPKAGASVRLWTIHALGGFAIALPFHIEIAPHVRFDLGRFDASSFGVSTLGEGSAVSVGLGLGAVVSLPISRSVRLVVGFDGVANLARPRFIVTPFGGAHEPWPFVMRIALGPEVQF